MKMNREPRIMGEMAHDIKQALEVIIDYSGGDLKYARYAQLESCLRDLIGKHSKRNNFKEEE
ncbi:hypothetical protein [Candidatus Oleimmundimicrobium sp.]|uniref:hypothetical protein n=1 Tax=Candidatus Oleimmundimicrobium sp. TaxID=3060597 RepID=UPI00271782B9|nr:hypothetical protein [Candidatus Oleimmundimicrobium sp.]MDO8885745.1 hypothetical protein [Candidatus Oleimmundimicrobium sp.]